MKIASNQSNWGGYAKAHDDSLDIKQFNKDVAASGCSGIEVGGLDKTFESPAEALSFISDQGLEIAAYGGNITYNPWQPNVNTYQKGIQFAADLGVKTIMCCGGFPITQRRNTYDFDYDMFATSIGPMVDFAKEHGLEIAYHPHRGAICETADETQKILERVEDLKICVDIAHLEASGDDAVAFIKRFINKITYTHIKDYSWDKDSFMELGQGCGKLVVSDCIKALNEGDYDGWYGLELDRDWSEGMPTPIESTKMSIAYLQEQLVA